ncbi:MAG TPA: ATP-binding protein [Verrucomicrobiae bacterium]
MSLFADLSDEDLECIRMGEIVEMPAGKVVATDTQVAEYFYLLLSGEVRIWRSYDRQDILMAVGKPGDFMGEISLLLDTPWLATPRISVPSRFFRLNKDGFWKMMRTCPSIAREIMRTVAERFRNLEGFAHQREKLISLGTMAAGLAHELNNPASAALRASSDSQHAADSVQSLLCQLVKKTSPADWKSLVHFSEDALSHLQSAPPLDALARSDREEALGEWLENHRISEGWKLAGTFVAAGLDAVWFEKLCESVPPEIRSVAVQWIEARLNLKLLLRQVENSTGRVVELVKAVKSYTHMDNAGRQELDIHEGLENTLTMLGHKLKSVTVRRDYDRTIPKISAYGGELNQVWTNLIDNAIDAVKGTGKICIATWREGDHVVVEIVDYGSGIPKEVQAHMFEPFFTTKSIGSGTGLGLVICHRIIADRHGGEIEFESKPGETRFKVRIPIAGA